MSLCAKLVPRNQKDVVPAVQIESPGTGQRAGNSMVPPGAAWELRPLQAEALCQVQQSLPLLFLELQQTLQT